MGKLQPNGFHLRTDKELMEKFKVIAAENGRSANKEIEIMMKEAVKKWEAENGPIEIVRWWE